MTVPELPTIKGEVCSDRPVPHRQLNGGQGTKSCGLHRKDEMMDPCDVMMDQSDVSPSISEASSEEWNFVEETHSALHKRRMTAALQEEVRNLTTMNDRFGMKEIKRSEEIGRFFTKKRSHNMPMDRYIQRIMRYMSCSSSTYVVAFVYLHRLLKYEPRLCLSDFNAHRLYLTAVVLACKYMEDRQNSNRFYAKLGALSSVHEMNALEAEFLRVMRFDLAVSLEEYNTMESYLGGIADRCCWRC